MTDQEKKAWAQYRMRLTGALEPFKGYGQGVFIPEAVGTIISLTEELFKSLKEQS